MGIRGYDQWKTASPYDADDYPCAICGVDPADCKCPECQQCGAVADPGCLETCDLKANGEALK